MNNRMTRIMKIAIIGILAIVIFGFVIMGLWNWLMPVLFALPKITFWQALGLFILGKLLFGGFHRHGNGGRHWRRRMRERWERMTPEERERFRQGMGGFCGPAATEPKA